MTPAGRLDLALRKLSEATTRIDRFYALDDAATQSFVLGRVDDAGTYARELLSLAGEFERDWNYGNAIHDGNMVLGRIALVEGRIADAKELLIAAGRSPGSPQLDTFGPNMSLAKDLLEKGERDVVLGYFEDCRRFWEMHNGDLDRWADEVRRGEMPDFSANLVY